MPKKSKPVPQPRKLAKAGFELCEIIWSMMKTLENWEDKESKLRTARPSGRRAHNGSNPWGKPAPRPAGTTSLVTP